MDLEKPAKYDVVEYEDGKEYERHGSPEYYKFLEKMAELHDRKSHDYASDDNPVGNYHFAGVFALLFKHSPEDAGFAGRIGEKIYRLANLESSGSQPKNESIEDTELDIAVITTLWMADRIRRRQTERQEQSANQSKGYICWYCNKKIPLGEVYPSHIEGRATHKICYDIFMAGRLSREMDYMKDKSDGTR